MSLETASPQFESTSLLQRLENSFLAYVIAQAMNRLYLLPLAGLLLFVLFAPTPELAGVSKLDIYAQGNALRQIVFSAGFLLALFGLAIRGKIVFAEAYHQKLMLLFLTYVLLSVFWASAPLLSLKRAVQAAGMLLVGWCALGLHFPVPRIVRALRWIFTIALLASIAKVFLQPGAAIDPSGAWRGIHYHKNTLGQVATILVALWLPILLYRAGRLEKLLAVPMIAAGFLAAVKSDSVTSQFAIALLILAWLAFDTPLRWRVKLSLFPIPVLLFFFWYTNLQPHAAGDFIVHHFNRDDTLTGRTVLWPRILDNMQDHLLIGTGYNSFWTSANPSAADLTASLGWDPGQAHSGYLDVLNELGIVGAALFLLVLVQAVVRARRYYAIDRPNVTVLFLIIISQLILNLTETVFCRGTSPGWFIFLVAYVALSSYKLLPHAQGARSPAPPPRAV